MPVRAVFDAPTVERLAARIAGAAGLSDTNASPIERVSRAGVLQCERLVLPFVNGPNAHFVLYSIDSTARRCEECRMWRVVRSGKELTISEVV